MAFINAKVIVQSASLAEELRGLFLRIHVCTPAMKHYFYAELFPEATTAHTAEIVAAAAGRRDFGSS